MIGRAEQASAESSRVALIEFESEFESECSARTRTRTRTLNPKPSASPILRFSHRSRSDKLARKPDNELLTAPLECRSSGLLMASAAVSCSALRLFSSSARCLLRPSRVWLCAIFHKFAGFCALLRAFARSCRVSSSCSDLQLQLQLQPSRRRPD